MTVSILKKNRNIITNRLDASGTPISLKGKKHKITFRKVLEDVNEVESYKEYNNENYTQPTCYCNIFWLNPELVNFL